MLRVTSVLQVLRRNWRCPWTATLATGPRIAAAVLLLGLAVAACAGGPAGPESTADPATEPAGVDAELWDTLTAELGDAIECAGTARRANAAPTGTHSAVCDLHLHTFNMQSTFSWSYRQHGDYDLNGEVNVSDLTQVGVHFGKTVDSPDWQVAQLADGDNNGEVNVSDVTPIGQNFGGRIDGYELQSRMNAGEDFHMGWELPFIPGDKLSGLYPVYDQTTQSVVAGPEYSVVPYCETGSTREYGPRSNIYRTLYANKTNWPTAAANNQRTSLSQAAGPVDIGSTWETELEGMCFFQEPITDLNGTIYAGTAIDSEAMGNNSLPGYLYAVSPDGEVRWRYRTKGGIISTPSANKQARIVTGDTTGMVYCLAPDGKQLWRTQLAGPIAYGSPLLDTDGTCYIVTHTVSGSSIVSSTLNKLLPDGAIEWSRQLNAECLSSPFFNGESQPSVMDSEGELYSFDYAGTSTYNWTVSDPPDGSLFASAAVVLEAFILYLSSGEYLHIYAYDKSLHWMTDLAEDPMNAPSINTQGQLVLVTRTTGVDPVNRISCYQGIAKQWGMDVSGEMQTKVAIDNQDRMYFGTLALSPGLSSVTNGISCYKPDQNLAWFHPTEGRMVLSAILADENLVVSVVGPFPQTGADNCSLVGIRGN